ncbi:MAG: flagellar regulator YcgR PilZN domain-containing protein [Burkholderiales bacterium]|jgi:c-di-GMP-binding flagellar brake protein YcgR
MSTNHENTNSSSHLLRSRSKIAPVLEALAARHERVTVELPDKQGLVATHLIRADPAGEFIIVAAAADGGLNAALLALARVTLVAEPHDWHIEFVSVAPGEVMHEGVAAIRLAYPEILTVQQRRQDERYDAAPTLVLRCVADAGGIAPFDAQIKDISLGGISVLLYPPDVMIEPGTVLVGSRIEIPGADTVTVDLEVRYSELLTLEDGSRARCSGFRFLNAPDEVKQKLVDAINNP